MQDTDIYFLRLTKDNDVYIRRWELAQNNVDDISVSFYYAPFKL